MSITSQPWFRKMLVAMAGKPLLKKYLDASRDLNGSQDMVLREIIDLGKDTAFGREHNFHSIKTVEDYRAAVPIRTFEGHRPYVERLCRGESNVLCPGKPLFYTTTSGTTTKPKYIPIFSGYFEKYNEMSRIWLYSTLQDNPALYNGKSLSVVAPAEEGNVEDGTPYGSISGVTYRNIPPVLKSTYSAPYPLICIKDYDRKYYALVRSALGADITFIISASPSNVLRIHEVAVENWDAIVRDIHDGTLRGDVLAAMDPAARAEVRFGPDRRRAALLEKLMREQGVSLRPKHYWPNLACVNMWRQGSFAIMVPRFEGYFPPGAAIRAFGYWASEFRGGLVLGNDWEHSVLTAHVHHYEFIEEHEHGREDARALSAHEVEVGKRYFIVCTNGSGLYRYDINDMVEIIGHLNQYPLFKFIRRGEGETDLTGEKLSEPQVIAAVQAAAKESGIAVPFFTMLCDIASRRYLLFAEFGPGTTAEKKAGFAHAVDLKLTSFNYEWERKRGSKRLDAPVLVELKENSYEMLKARLCAAGLAREGQYKDLYLRRGAAHLKYFLELAR